MMWRSIETLLLFVVVGRKRLLEKWQDVLAEELLQNLCASFKGKEHSDGCFSLWKNLRVPSRFKVDADKYLWGIFTHTKDFWFSSLLFETPLCFSFMWEYTNNLCLLDVIFYFHNISWRSLQFSVIHHILNFISLYLFSFISLWYICKSLISLGINYKILDDLLHVCFRLQSCRNFILCSVAIASVYIISTYTMICFNKSLDTSEAALYYILSVTLRFVFEDK